VSENIDTTSPGGKLFFHVMGALAEFERDLIVERTKAGMQSARKRGMHLGRPRKLDAAQLEHAIEMIDQGKSRNEVARLLKVDPDTLYRRLKTETEKGGSRAKPGPPVDSKTGRRVRIK
jgi:DNA invertase Pin-like site-specific DNA recombinase